MSLGNWHSAGAIRFALGLRVHAKLIDCKIVSDIGITSQHGTYYFYHWKVTIFSVDFLQFLRYHSIKCGQASERTTYFFHRNFCPMLHNKDFSKSDDWKYVTGMHSPRPDLRFMYLKLVLLKMLFSKGRSCRSIVAMRRCFDRCSNHSERRHLS